MEKSRFGNTPILNKNALLSPDIFTDKATMFMFSEFSLKAGTVNKQDDPINHITNSVGFRSQEFGSVELLAAGCSQTFGMGVDADYIWPNILAKNLSVSHANLGNPGASPQTIVENVISFISKYGKPKIVCAVFPSLYRFRFALRHDTLTYPYKYRNMGSRSNVDDLNMIPDGISPIGLEFKPKISKTPHNIVEVFPYEAALYLSLNAIKHLVEYCKVADIQLLFSTWYPDTHEFFSKKKELGFDLPEYVALPLLETFYENPSLVDMCHYNSESLEFWDKGLDTAMHMGAHQHLHFAEIFSERILANE